MSKLKNIVKVLLVLSGLYFLFSIFTEILLISIFLFHINLGFIFESLNDGILGLSVMFFVVIFVANIVISRRITNAKNTSKVVENKKVKSQKKLVIIRVILAINIVFAVIWFVRVQGVIEGTPSYDDDGFYVHYRGEFVKTITEEQFFQYRKDFATATTFLFVAVFVFFSGSLFLSFLDSYAEINERNNRKKIE